MQLIYICMPVLMLLCAFPLGACDANCIYVHANELNNRHGVRQLRTGWSDGPAYVTQCPIQTGQSFVYNFTITGQRGTLFWHAHVSWMRATLYGAIVILPKRGVPYPLPVKPYKDVPVIFGTAAAVLLCL